MTIRLLILGIIASAMIALKLFGVIAWPWWIVLSPIWGTLTFLFLLLAFLGIAQWLDEEAEQGQEGEVE